MAVTGWLLLAGCGEATDFAQRLVDRRPARQRYLDGLVQAGLGDAAMVRDWIAAGDRAFGDAPPVTSPHREEVDLPPHEAGAIGLKIELKRGQLVRFEVSLPGDTLATIFLDTRYAGTSGDSLGPATAESHRGERFVSFEPRRDGWYVFRAQPELFRGGRFAVTLSIAPMLAFPVSGRGEPDILSKWGAPRDGGRRLHQGVDIFAPRGTPVIAAANGRVVEVGENDLGGLVVWLRDERGYTQYYAHLSSQLVTTGASVAQGDTIGLVGNTGNARTTPPHLHFGVYRRGEGPIDPFWFFHKPPGSVARLTVDTSLLGGYARSRLASAVVRRGPRQAADTLRVLGRTDSVWVVAAIGGWYRVRLDDGAEGFLVGRSAERIGLDEPRTARGTGVVSAP
ncbi:MAG: peptidoglycan DD-metalloendopeptidase family protein [Gemmatimonadales bacterium]